MSTEKNIRDYLHLYLGAECIADGNEFTLTGVELTDTGTLAYDGTMINGVHQCWWAENCDFKICLRPLSSITEEEKEVHRNSKHYEGFRYLLSKHFDLFGLIDAGLAIDSTLKTSTK